MTRDEALSRDPPALDAPHNQTATGSDGTRWFQSCRNPSRGDDRTFEILSDGRRFYSVEAETDPPDVDWAPGAFDPPKGALPVSDPAVESAKASGRGGPCRE